MPDSKTKKCFNPWPMGLGLTLALFCAIQTSVVCFASSSFQGLDDVEYYRHGVEYGQEIARQRNQRELGWSVDSHLKEDRLMIAVVDSDGKPVTRAKAEAVIGRPASLKDDRRVPLVEVGPGIYVALVKTEPGAWRIRWELSKGDIIVKVESREALAAHPAERASL